MNQHTIFRALILASSSIAVLAVCVDFLIPGLVPPSLKEAYEAYRAAEELSLPLLLALLGFAVALFIGGIAGTIGLFLYKQWGRQLSLWLSVLAMLLYPFGGIVVNSAWANMLTDVSQIIWGAVLAMAYFSDVKARFAPEVANNVVQATREDARA